MILHVRSSQPALRLQGLRESALYRQTAGCWLQAICLPTFPRVLTGSLPADPHFPLLVMKPLGWDLGSMSLQSRGGGCNSTMIEVCEWCVLMGLHLSVLHTCYSVYQRPWGITYWGRSVGRYSLTYPRRSGGY